MIIPEDEIGIGYYVVAYIDLLGQSKSLEDLGNLPQNDTEKLDFLKRLRPPYNNLKLFRNQLRELTSQLNVKGNIPDSLKNKLSGEEQILYLKYCNGEVVEFLGDAAIIKVCLREDIGRNSPLISLTIMFNIIEIIMCRHKIY